MSYLIINMCWWENEDILFVNISIENERENEDILFVNISIEMRKDSTLA